MVDSRSQCRRNLPIPKHLGHILALDIILQLPSCIVFTGQHTTGTNNHVNRVLPNGVESVGLNVADLTSENTPVFRIGPIMCCCETFFFWYPGTPSNVLSFSLGSPNADPPKTIFNPPKKLPNQRVRHCKPPSKHRCLVNFSDVSSHKRKTYGIAVSKILRRC